MGSKQTWTGPSSGSSYFHRSCCANLVDRALELLRHGQISLAMNALHNTGLSPQQVAVGVPGGISVLVHSVKLGLEAHPGHVVVKCDLRNAFNEVERATMLERVLQSPVRALAPLLTSSSAPWPTLLKRSVP